MYQWGTCGDYQFVGKDPKNPKEFLAKSICQYPTKVSFRHLVEQSSGSAGGISGRRKSGQDNVDDSSPYIIDFKMGEQFTIALSQRGYCYTWGMNDKGQLGNGTEYPSYEPIQVSNIGATSQHPIKAITKIACGLKHCLVMTKNSQLVAWGSNLQCQLGKKLSQMQGQGQAPQAHSNLPVVVNAYD